MFQLQNFALVGAGAVDAPTIYSYKSVDPLSLVTAQGYFNDKRLELERGDYIFLMVGSLNLMSQVLADTSSIDLVGNSEVLRGSSFADQEPTLVDTPLQIEYGPAINDVNDQAMMAADGTITINEFGRFNIRFLFHYGRSGAGSVSWLFFRVLVNGVQDGNSIFAKMDDSRNDVPAQFTIAGTFQAGDVITSEILRDSQGNNSGGLLSESPTLGDWNDNASATVVVTRKVG